MSGYNEESTGHIILDEDKLFELRGCPVLLFEKDRSGYLTEKEGQDRPGRAVKEFLTNFKTASKGLSSVRVNDRYRIEFEEYVVDGQSIANNLEPFRPHRPGSDEFCKIGPVTACMADCLEHNAPKSPQKHRLRSAQELQATDNWMFTRKARAQVISSARHGALCSGGSGDPPEREIPPQVREPAETASQPRRNHLTR